MAHSFSHTNPVENANPVEYGDPIEYKPAETAGPTNPLAEGENMNLGGEEDEEYKGGEEEQAETPTVQLKTRSSLSTACNQCSSPCGKGSTCIEGGIVVRIPC